MLQMAQTQEMQTWFETQEYQLEMAQRQLDFDEKNLSHWLSAVCAVHHIAPCMMPLMVPRGCTKNSPVSGRQMESLRNQEMRQRQQLQDQEMREREQFRQETDSWSNVINHDSPMQIHAT